MIPTPTTPTTPTPTPVPPPVHPPTPVPPPVPPVPPVPPAPIPTPAPAPVPTPELPKEPVEMQVIVPMMLIYAVAAFTYNLAFKKAVSDIQSAPDGHGLFLLTSTTRPPLQVEVPENSASGMAGLKMNKDAASAAVAAGVEIDLALNIPTEITPEAAEQGLTELDEDLPNEEESPD